MAGWGWGTDRGLNSLASYSQMLNTRNEDMGWNPEELPQDQPVDLARPRPGMRLRQLPASAEYLLRGMR